MTSRRIERLETELATWRTLAADLAGHLSSAVEQGCCPDCITHVRRYRAQRDGAPSTGFDPTTVAYAGDPGQR